MKNAHTPEYSPSGTEFTPPGAEFTPPSQEFCACEEFPSRPDAGEKKRSRRRKMLLLTSALVVVMSLALPRKAAEQAPPETQPVEVTDASTQPSETAPAPSAPTQAPTEAATLPPETLPVPATYPLDSGRIDITVYNESIDMETLSSKILYQDSFQEADFTELPLPQPEPQEGFSFMCFVLKASKDSSGRIHYYRLQDNLSREDVTLVAPGEDGIRHVEIYAAWQTADSDDPWMRLILDGNGGTPTAEYDATGPLASGGSVFLCAYPVPERPGYQFAGWYEDPECSGDPVETISPLVFFAAGENGIDWSSSVPVTLYARWIPE